MSKSPSTVGLRHDLVRRRDGTHLGTLFLNRTLHWEFEDPETGKRHASPIARDVVLVVIRAWAEEICRLTIPVAELLGDKPYLPSASEGEGHDRLAPPPVITTG